ncbi:MAG: hypothetical protein WAT92_17830 [Saprospiraceae bacterium]
MNNVIDKVNKNQIHVLLLGAGASKAAMPNGDKNGTLVPLMNELSQLSQIKSLVDPKEQQSAESNFEAWYSEQVRNDKFQPRLEKLNDEIFNYFAKLELPDEPTIYDYILLSLKENDVIATFNWDPFLVQSYQRVKRITTNLPKIFFLHGTVSLGRCEEHLIVDNLLKTCPKCGQKLSRIKLLYPTEQKDYISNDFIKEQWDAIQFYLKKANGMTIFGYAAPKSDEAAIELLQYGWGLNSERIMEEIEIINIDQPKIIQDSWKSFIHENHFSIYSDYFDSSIANFPRRVSEYQFCRFNLNMWLDNHKIEKGLNFEDLKNRFGELIKYESS